MTWKTSRFWIGIVVTLFFSSLAAAQNSEAPVIEDPEAGLTESPQEVEPEELDAEMEEELPAETDELDEISEGDDQDPVASRADIGLVIGGKIGAGFSQVFSDLGTSFVGELEIGYLLPLPDPINRDIEIFLTGQYTQPPVEGKTSEPDARLPGDGIMKYDITQQQLTLTLGALYRIPVGGELLRPYAALGGRIVMMRTLVQGKGGGQDFGENDETTTEPGFYGALGCDLFLGPGAVLLELQFTYAPLDGFVMRDTNAGAMNIAAGYRLII